MTSSLENQSKADSHPQFPPIVRVGGLYYVNRTALDRFKRELAADIEELRSKPAERNQLVRLSRAASELGVAPRTLQRWATSQSASA